MGLFDKFFKTIVNSYIAVLIGTAVVCLVIGVVACKFFL